MRQERPEAIDHRQIRMHHFPERLPEAYFAEIFANPEHEKIILVRDLRDVCVSALSKTTSLATQTPFARDKSAAGERLLRLNTKSFFPLLLAYSTKL